VPANSCDRHSAHCFWGCPHPSSPPPRHPPHFHQILAIIAFNLIAAFLPARGKFIPDEEELEERPKGPLQDPRISILEPKKFFGITGFGFTKQNELFVGRMAQLGFAAGEWAACAWLRVQHGGS
jgi:hypothetical protein